MSDGLLITYVLAGIVAGVLVLTGGIGLTVRYVTHHYDKATCHAWADKTGREMRFVDYTFWQWDCLTLAADGKWISTDNLREFVK